MAGLRSESRSLMPMPLLLTGAVEAELLRVYLEKKKGDGASASRASEAGGSAAAGPAEWSKLFWEGLRISGYGFLKAFAAQSGSL